MSAFKETLSQHSERHLEVVPRADGTPPPPMAVPGTSKDARQRRRGIQFRERVRTTPVAWYGHAELTREEWETYGSRLGTVTRSSSWWLGDWVRFGQRHYNDHKIEFASHITGYDEQTLRNFAYVAGRCEFSRRRENLSWSHHAEIAALEPDEQDRWLEEAAIQALSVRGLRQRVRTRPPTPSRENETSTEQPGAVSLKDSTKVLPLVCDHCGATTHVPVKTIIRTLRDFRAALGLSRSP